MTAFLRKSPKLRGNIITGVRVNTKTNHGVLDHGEGGGEKKVNAKGENRVASWEFGRSRGEVFRLAI
ncbi:MAG: hypothetical protein CMJ62_05245 [Planctomycetaceae bacterium]|nr:hypothetical protein [Planctomycetaceae bacterium]